MLQLKGKDCQSRYNYILSQRDTVNTNRLQLKEWKKMYHANIKTTKTKAAILISNKTENVYYLITSRASKHLQQFNC